MLLMQTPRPDRFTYPHGLPEDDVPPTYPARKARRGEIVLKKSWMIAIFAVGLIGALLLGFFGGYYG